MKKEGIILPIYLNEKIVFDSLAILEGGFSKLSTIQEINKENSDMKAGVTLEAKTGSILSKFFSVGVKSNIEGKDGKEEQKSETKDKIHTPTSLFVNLKKELNERKLVREIKDIKDFNKVSVGDFVEMDGKLFANPLIKSLETIKGVLDIITKFPELTKEKNGKNQNKELKKILEIIDSLLVGFRDEKTIDVICRNEEELKMVIPTHLEYFTNGNLGEVVDGEYNVFGKVMKKVENDGTDSISLLRNTSFGNLTPELVQPIIEPLQSLSQFTKDMDIQINIEYPAIFVVPIAIYN